MTSHHFPWDILIITTLVVVGLSLGNSGIPIIWLAFLVIGVRLLVDVLSVEL